MNKEILYPGTKVIVIDGDFKGVTGQIIGVEIEREVVKAIGGKGNCVSILGSYITEIFYRIKVNFSNTIIVEVDKVISLN